MTFFCQARAHPHQVRFQGIFGQVTQHGQAFLAALAKQTHQRDLFIEVYIVNRQINRLGNPGSRRVEELQQRPISQRIIVAGRTSGFEQGLDSSTVNTVGRCVLTLAGAMPFVGFERAAPVS